MAENSNSDLREHVRTVYSITYCSILEKYALTRTVTLVVNNGPGSVSAIPLSLRWPSIFNTRVQALHEAIEYELHVVDLGEVEAYKMFVKNAMKW